MTPPFLNYDIYINNLVAETPLRKIDIYDYKEEEPDLDLSKEYQILFNFYQGWIEQQQKFGIFKSNIFFNPFINVNAKATKHNDHFIISINRGVIYTLWNKFQTNHKLFEASGLHEFNTIQQKSDWPFNKLMFQLCCHFTFYHELGHLIQDSELLKSGLSEDISSDKKFSQYRHIMEYDADAYSGICLSTHIYKYLEYCHIIDNKEAELIISAIGSSIFTYLLMFESTKLPFYTKEYSHPHPFVRLFSVLDYMVGYIEHLDKEKDIYKLNTKTILKKLIQCSKVIINMLMDEDSRKRIDKLMDNNINEAIKYSKELKELNVNNQESAFNKRNEKVMNENGL